MSGIEGKTIIITGATSGIGRATALASGRAGANVVVTGRREDAGQAVVGDIERAGGSAIFAAVDVRDEAQIADAIDTAERRFGGIDIAFNNAGGGRHFASVSDLSADAWNDEIAVNLTGVFLALKHEIPALRRRGGGTIINNASQLGLVGIAGGVSAYVAAKHGVVGLTRAAALETAEENIRVTAIAPAGVDTPLFRDTMGASEEGAAFIRSLHPIKRIASPEEVADLVLYLAGPTATFFTGSVIAMDGGWTAQ